MDKILISAIDCVAAIGVTAEERTIKQRLSIDIELFVDSSKPAQHGFIKGCARLFQSRGAGDGGLPEPGFPPNRDSGGTFGRAGFSPDFPVPQVRVLVRKISPVVEPRVNYVSIEIVRSR